MAGTAEVTEITYMKDEDVESWGLPEVGVWLEHLKMPNYKEAFAENNIAGQELVDLSAEDLKLLGVTSLGHRKRLLKAITKLASAAGCGCSAQKSTASQQPTESEIDTLLDDGDNSDSDDSGSEDGSDNEAESAILFQTLATDNITEFTRSLSDNTINSRQAKTGKTFLHVAVELGRLPAIQLLLTFEGLATTFDKNGFAPLHIAVKTNQIKAVDLLLQNGADPNITSRSTIYTSYTPLHFACSTSSGTGTSDEIIETLLNAGANPTAPDSAGTTPIHLASRHRGVNVCCMLLKGGKDVDTLNYSLITPLMMAASQGSLEMTRYLLSENARLDLQDSSGDSALHHAFQSQLQRVFNHGFDFEETQEHVAYALAHHGSPLDLKNKDQVLAIDYAGEGLRAILQVAHECGPKKLLPPLLSSVLALDSTPQSTRDAFSAAMGYPLFKKLLIGIQLYKIEAKETADRKSGQGGCPMMTTSSLRGNRVTRQLGITQSKEQKQSADHALAKAVMGGDESKCPHLNKQKAEAATKLAEGAESKCPHLNRKKEEATTVEEDVSQCPFMNQKKEAEVATQLMGGDASKCPHLNKMKVEAVAAEGDESKCPFLNKKDGEETGGAVSETGAMKCPFLSKKSAEGALGDGLASEGGPGGEGGEDCVCM
eukprot:TRINITY_DN12776_c0_g1_i1.p1 TRINITY_DN12776_c0_g1~~TRINITY_DN12776_c0_g1_i1.p1  ORF type:complete len:656 (+),score=133.09 TRINITY_DN12776_c0_g1_i1:122-2089(+)